MKTNYNLTSIILVSILVLFTSSAFAEEKEIVAKDSTATNTKTIGNYYWIIYDNVCPYCKQASKYIKELDWEGRFKFISYRDPLTYIMFPFLTKEECEKDVHMVTPEGKILAGYMVFRTVIDNLTATKIFNPLLKNNFAEAKLNEIYEKMVESRSCYYEKSESCKLGEHRNEHTDSSEIK